MSSMWLGSNIDKSAGGRLGRPGGSWKGWYTTLRTGAPKMKERRKNYQEGRLRNHLIFIEPNLGIKYWC